MPEHDYFMKMALEQAGQALAGGEFLVKKSPCIPMSCAMKA